MIRRELPLTSDASPAEPVANFRRGFSFVLAPAAADPALELNCIVHRLVCLCFFLIWKVFVFAFRFPSCCQLLRAGRFRLDTDGPDESHQFACNRGHGLSLVFACCHQLHVALVQAILRLPCSEPRRAVLASPESPPALGSQCFRAFIRNPHRSQVAGAKAVGPAS